MQMFAVLLKWALYSLYTNIVISDNVTSLQGSN
jgi:hypothetical protein